MFRSVVLLGVWLAVQAASAAVPASELIPPDCSIDEAIDYYVNQRLREAGVEAAPSAADLVLVRRTSLDLAGRIPTPAEARAYQQSTSADKRRELVDRLLGSPDFLRHQADCFDTLLMAGTRESLQEYLQQAFAENRPWDRMFREMLMGREDDREQKGALRFVRARVQDIDRLTNEVSVLFFGVNISCAQCHDHPLVADWSQEHFFGMKSFFNRTFENGGYVGERDYGFVSYQTTSGESRDAPLMFLSGEAALEPPVPEPDNEARKAEKALLEELKKNKQPPPLPSFSRRAQLVEIGLQSDANYFAKAIVNHLWNRFFGRGLVSPVDQMHSENPPSHPELLAWLARDLARNGYDLRRLIRGMVLSQTYARSSVWEGGDRPPAELLAVAAVRPMSPRQYATSLHLASRNPELLQADVAPAELQQRIDRSAQQSVPLAEQFATPEDDFQISVDEALVLSNGERWIDLLLGDRDDSLVRHVSTRPDRGSAFQAASWSIFGRPPTDHELGVYESFVSQRHDRPIDAYRQLLWAMLTSSECRFNY